MGSNLLDGRPAPVSPIGGYPGCNLVLACCRCGRTRRVRVVDLLHLRGVAPDTPFHRLAGRLRCAACGGPGRIEAVEGWSRR